MSRSVYKLRTQPSGPRGAFRSHLLGIPSDIAEALIEADITLFTVELTEDGLLYRPVIASRPTIDKPSWLEAKA